MFRGELNQEALLMLPTASRRVAERYATTQSSWFSTPEDEAANLEEWDRLARNHPPFTETIMVLKDRLQIVAGAVKEYPPYAITGIITQFSHLSNPYSRTFLADVLISRLLSFKTFLDGDINATDEAKAMAQELGLRHGWHSMEGTTISYKRVVESVLTNRLKITPRGANPPQS